MRKNEIIEYLKHFQKYAKTDNRIDKDIKDKMLKLLSGKKRNYNIAINLIKMNSNISLTNDESFNVSKINEKYLERDYYVIKKMYEIIIEKKEEDNNIYGKLENNKKDKNKYNPTKEYDQKEHKFCMACFLIEKNPYYYLIRNLPVHFGTKHYELALPEDKLLYSNEIFKSKNRSKNESLCNLKIIMNYANNLIANYGCYFSERIKQEYLTNVNSLIENHNFYYEVSDNKIKDIKANRDTKYSNNQKTTFIKKVEKGKIKKIKKI